MVSAKLPKSSTFFLSLIPFLWPLGKLQVASVKLRRVVSFQRLEQEQDNEGNAVMLWERLAQPWKSRVVALQSTGAPRNNTCCPISDLLRCEPDLSSDLSSQPPKMWGQGIRFICSRDVKLPQQQIWSLCCIENRRKAHFSCYLYQNKIISINLC